MTVEKIKNQLYELIEDRKSLKSGNGCDVVDNEIYDNDITALTEAINAVSCVAEMANIAKTKIAHRDINCGGYYAEESKAEPSTTASDNVNHPSHYETSGIECIVAMEAAQGADAVKDFCICNAFKYIWRHKRKNGAEDIKKAVWYLTKWLELEGGNKNA